MTSARLKVGGRTNIAPFMVMDVLAAANARAASGADVVHLEVGEPGQGPPAAVLEAARRLLGEVRLGYTEALGLPSLRRALAGHYRRRYDLDVPPERIIVTVGASGAFVLGFLGAFDPGDRVVVPEPAFPAYRNILEALGIEVVRLETGEASDFKPTPDLLGQLEGPLHGLIIASPANPTGTMLGADELEALAAFCRARAIRLVADEIYHGITFEAPAASALAAADEAIIIGGFSKYFCMTGWRLGWLVAPPDLVRPIERLAQNLYIAAPTLAQHAAIEALACYQELDRRIDGYRVNRDLVLERLCPMGLDRFAPPDGAFYLYFDVGHLGCSTVLCRQLLEETGVALAPGADFDRGRGDRFVRLAFCGGTQDVRDGADRLAGWLARRR